MSDTDVSADGEMTAIDAADLQPVEGDVTDEATAVDQYDDERTEDELDDEEAGEGAESLLDIEGEVAADYLEELLDIVDLDGDIDTFVETGRAHVSIITDNKTLVGRDGEVLEALQELTRLAVLVETGRRSRLMLDIGGHRESRRQELQELAADAIEEVKETGESIRLAPMNPFERKIVHDAVAAAGLYSESEGEEPNRRVVVMTAE